MPLALKHELGTSTFRRVSVQPLLSGSPWPVVHILANDRQNRSPDDLTVHGLLLISIYRSLTWGALLRNKNIITSRLHRGRENSVTTRSWSRRSNLCFEQRLLRW